MEALFYLIPAALFLGMLGLGAFFWALKSGQFDDMDGAGERILLDDPIKDAGEAGEAGKAGEPEEEDKTAA